jgi:hypothetical protein
MDTRNIPEPLDQHNSADAADTLVVATIPKNKSDDLVVSLCRFNGHNLLDLRVHAAFGGDATKRPTRKGISINVTRLPELIAALHGAADEARRLGLLADDAPDATPADTGPRDRIAAERQRRRRARLRSSRPVTGDSVIVTDNVTSSLFEQKGDPTPNN